MVYVYGLFGVGWLPCLFGWAVFARIEYVEQDSTRRCTEWTIESKIRGGLCVRSAIPNSLLRLNWQWKSHNIHKSIYFYLFFSFRIFFFCFLLRLFRARFVLGSISEFSWFWWNLETSAHVRCSGIRPTLLPFPFHSPRMWTTFDCNAVDGIRFSQMKWNQKKKTKYSGRYRRWQRRFMKILNAEKSKNDTLYPEHIRRFIRMKGAWYVQLDTSDLSPAENFRKKLNCVQACVCEWEECAHM